MATAAGGPPTAVLAIEPSVFHSMDDALKRLARFLGRVPDWRELMRFLPDELRGEQMRRSALAATFAAALELARDGRVELRQDRAFGPIYLRSPPRHCAGDGEGLAGERPGAATAAGRGAAVRRRRAVVAKQILAQRLGDGGRCSPDLLRELAEHYAGRGVNLVRLAGGWTFRTAPDLAAALAASNGRSPANCRAPRSRPWRSSPITSR